MFKDKTVAKKEAKRRIRRRIRKKIQGTPERPRVFVRKSNRYLYAQAIDDLNHRVLTTATSLEKDFQKNNKNKYNNPYQHETQYKFQHHKYMVNNMYHQHIHNHQNILNHREY